MRQRSLPPPISQSLSTVSLLTTGQGTAHPRSVISLHQAHAETGNRDRQGERYLKCWHYLPSPERVEEQSVDGYAHYVTSHNSFINEIPTRRRFFGHIHTHYVNLYTARSRRSHFPRTSLSFSLSLALCTLSLPILVN